MRSFRVILCSLFFLGFVHCADLIDPFHLFTGGGGTDTPSISGSPTTASQNIYDSSDLSDLCDSSDCEADYDKLSESYREFYQEDHLAVCAFDYDPNESSQFLIHRETGPIDGLELLLSKHDLFFLAWVSMRYQINPHFLLGVMAAESYGNCAAVSVAEAEGCFQITNFYGRLQLEASYPQRIASWFWSHSLSGYYPDFIFESQFSWFGEHPLTDQFRHTLDPGAQTVLGVEVSSVVNFHFGVIASGLYYRWLPYFLYYNYSSLRNLTKNLIQNNEEEKTVLMAAAYNAGIGSLTNALRDFGDLYWDHLPFETQDYTDNVASYCAAFQQGDDFYDAHYNVGEVREIIDDLALTYGGLNIDWEVLKTEIENTFFTDQTEIGFTDDIKALIYFISTFTFELAPVWPEDVIS